MGLARFCLGLTLPLMVFSGCERAEVRKARQALQLVHVMVEELRRASAQASSRFTQRADFEDLRKAFGAELFDAGTPLGPDFQGNLAALMKDLETQLEKEPKDAEFLRKALRRVRKFHQWWGFVRQELETRRTKLAGATREQLEQRPRRERVNREEVLAILAETLQVVGSFEASTIRCIRGIEALVAES
ncbi:hypothetical protein GETHLI_25610 [Geothrix limicola]|uniref:Uncharacterized protein n=1 Tax=Geothrix limicola TaxID=2927978 RepID=A0ABQ5QHJ7_9BACT|nr:hypothetical protein [Geothrix limicola]GLH74059.1 hypothetical protein GETHLI_25610 [Geothrix limicola]